MAARHLEQRARIRSRPRRAAGSFWTVRHERSGVRRQLMSFLGPLPRPRRRPCDANAVTCGCDNLNRADQPTTLLPRRAAFGHLPHAKPLIGSC